MFINLYTLNWNRTDTGKNLLLKYTKDNVVWNLSCSAAPGAHIPVHTHAHTCTHTHTCAHTHRHTHARAHMASVECWPERQFGFTA